MVCEVIQLIGYVIGILGSIIGIIGTAYGIKKKRELAKEQRKTQRKIQRYYESKKKTEDVKRADAIVQLGKRLWDALLGGKRANSPNGS